MHLLKF
jgi:hypothetical protein